MEKLPLLVKRRMTRREKIKGNSQAMKRSWTLLMGNLPLRKRVHLLMIKRRAKFKT